MVGQDEETDVDILVVVPSGVRRDTHFFGTMHLPLSHPECCVLAEILRADSRVEGLTEVPEAFIPVLRFRWDGVEVDLTLGTPGLERLPASLDGLLNDISRHDASTLRCLSAVRVAQTILDSVPDRSTFRVALTLIKGKRISMACQDCARACLINFTVWAKRRGVYGKALGFFGGVLC